MRTHPRAAALVAATAIAAIAAPAAASAQSLWVAHAPTVPGNGISCTSPGYNSIQAAIGKASPGATLHVCVGTYEEQLQITHALSITTAGAVTVKLPAARKDSTTTCDEATGEPDQEIVAVCGAGTVKIAGVTFEGYWPGVCSDSLYGILVAGGANLLLSNSSVLGAGASPVNGCQGGVAVQVGTAWTTPVQVGTATLTNDTIAGYQKNGITVDGAESKASITSVTVTGAGATPVIAQNGIQVSNGARAKISKSTISGNECDHPSCGANPVTQTQSTGILFYGAAAGSTVSASTVNENDIGVYYEDSAATAPVGSEASIANSTLTNDRYESVVIGQGWATVNGNTLNGGNIGIALLQYHGESYGPKGTGKSDTVEHMKDRAVLGASDKQADPAGSFSIANSRISGNPEGAGVTGSVFSESASLNIFTTPSDT